MSENDKDTMLSRGRKKTYTPEELARRTAKLPHPAKKPEIAPAEFETTMKQPAETWVVRAWFVDGDSITSRINGTKEEIRRYYVGQWFNLGVGGRDRMSQCANVHFFTKTLTYEMC